MAQGRPPIIKKQNTFKSVPLDTGGLASCYWSTGLRKFVSESEVEWDINNLGMFYFKRFQVTPLIELALTSELVSDECINFVDESYWGTVTTGSWNGTSWSSEVLDGFNQIKLGDPQGNLVGRRPYAFLINRQNKTSDVRVSVYNGYNQTMVDDVTIVPGEEIPISFGGPIQPFDIDRIEFISSRVRSDAWIQSDGPQGFEITGNFTLDVRSWRELETTSGNNIYVHRHWFWLVNTVTGNGVRMGLSRYLNNSDSWYVERTAGGIPETSTSSYQRVSNGIYDNVLNRMIRTGDNIQAYWNLTSFTLGGAKFIGPDPLILVLGTSNSMVNGHRISNSFDNLNLVSGTYNGVNPDDDFTTLNTDKWTQHTAGGNPNNSTYIQSGRIWADTTINVGPYDITEIKLCQ